MFGCVFLFRVFPRREISALRSECMRPFPGQTIGEKVCALRRPFEQHASEGYRACLVVCFCFRVSPQWCIGRSTALCAQSACVLLLDGRLEKNCAHSGGPLSSARAKDIEHGWLCVFVLRISALRAARRARHVTRGARRAACKK